MDCGIYTLTFVCESGPSWGRPLWLSNYLSAQPCWKTPNFTPDPDLWLPQGPETAPPSSGRVLVPQVGTKPGESGWGLNQIIAFICCKMPETIKGEAAS